MFANNSTYILEEQIMNNCSCESLSFKNVIIQLILLIELIALMYFLLAILPSLLFKFVNSFVHSIRQLWRECFKSFLGIDLNEMLNMKVE